VPTARTRSNKLGAAPGHVVDVGQPRTAGIPENAPEQLVAILNRATAQVVAVQVREVEGEIGEALRWRSAIASCTFSMLR